MSNIFKVDEIDRKIIKLLKNNARIQWREIGEEINLSGQAVGDRVRKLVANNVITGFTTSVNSEILKSIRIDFVTVKMNSSDHKSFLNMVNVTDEITELYRVSGNGCYLLKVESNNQNQLNIVLDKILEYANYSLNSVIKKYK